MIKFELIIEKKMLSSITSYYVGFMKQIPIQIMLKNTSEIMFKKLSISLLYI